MTNAKTERILIIKFGAFGDVMMTPPLIDAILNHHPDANVTVLTTPPFAEVYRSWKRLEIWSAPRRGLREMLSIIRRMRNAGYSRVYDLQSNDRTRILLSICGIPERVGNHPRFPYTIHPETPWRGESHIFERMRTVLASAGIGDVRETVDLPELGDAEVEIDSWIERQGLNDARLVALHAGASATRPEKCWPYFDTLAQRLLNQGLTPVWLGAGPESASNAEITSRVGGIDASNEFSMTGLVALAKRCEFAVTNDSGPMHALAIGGCSVFGIFGPSDWRRNHAVGQASNVIAGVELLPEHHGKRTADCLQDLSVDTVWTEITTRTK